MTIIDEQYEHSSEHWTAVLETVYQRFGLAKMLVVIAQLTTDDATDEMEHKFATELTGLAAMVHMYYA